MRRMTGVIEAIREEGDSPSDWPSRESVVELEMTV